MNTTIDRNAPTITTLTQDTSINSTQGSMPLATILNVMEPKTKDSIKGGTPPLAIPEAKGTGDVDLVALKKKIALFEMLFSGNLGAISADDQKALLSKVGAIKSELNAFLEKTTDPKLKADLTAAIKITDNLAAALNAPQGAALNANFGALMMDLFALLQKINDQRTKQLQGQMQDAQSAQTIANKSADDTYSAAMKDVDVNKMQAISGIVSGSVSVVGGLGGPALAVGGKAKGDNFGSVLQTSSTLSGGVGSVAQNSINLSTVGEQGTAKAETQAAQKEQASADLMSKSADFKAGMASQNLNSAQTMMDILNKIQEAIVGLAQHVAQKV